MKKLYSLLTVLLPLVSVAVGHADFKADTVCLGQYTKFEAISDIADSLIKSYNWDLDNDNLFVDEQGQKMSYLFTSAGSFTVGLKIILKNNTSYIQQHTILINPVPEVNFQTDNLCAGNAAVFYNKSTISSGSLVQFNWDFNNDGVVDDASNDTVMYNSGPAGTYTSKLQVISDKGCSAFTTKTTQIFDEPQAKFSAINACIGNTVAFTDQTIIDNGDIAIYVWDFGDYQSSTIASPSHLYPQTGKYLVTLVAISSGNCKDTIQKEITVYDLPSVNITLSGDSIIYKNQEVTLTANGNFTNTLWSNNAQTNNITVNATGKYTVYVADGNGCENSASHTIQVKDVEKIEVKSNILTPNSDGINDYLEVSDLAAYSTCSINIYNAWGQQVYTSSDYHNNWNGTSDGTKLDAGTYYYLIKTNTGETKGSINILK